MKEIALSNGGTTLVDDADFDRLCCHKWHSEKQGKTTYAVHSFGPRGGQKNRYLHRVILGLEPGDGKKVDHRNGNGLDNRRDNLRVVSSRQNLQNINRSKNQQLGGFKGVYEIERVSKRGWAAQIVVPNPNGTGRGRAKYLGVHDSPEAAARAYDAAARSLFGDFASLNFEVHPPCSESVAQESS